MTASNWKSPARQDSTQRSIPGGSEDAAAGAVLRAVDVPLGYPRPRLTRPAWADLGGEWDFDWGTPEDRLVARPPKELGRRIRVPYPPEATASGLGVIDPQPVLWYRLMVTDQQITQAGWMPGQRRLLLHCGAVDYCATVWFGGNLLGHHEGGMTPFSFDITALVEEGGRELIVRAVDDPGDVGQPRGKQDWQTPEHSIWYDRTSGIWQPIWLEAVPHVYLADASVRPVENCTALDIHIEVGGHSASPNAVTVGAHAYWQGELLGLAQTRLVDGDSVSLRVELPRQQNGQQRDELLWSPENPRLLDLRLWVDSDGVVDQVGSYAGLRTVRTGKRKFWLNDRPFFIRAVLEQGYWPETHLAAPDGAALRREVELIKELGFNTARVHQKVEDPRFLYWADRLGLLIWGEMAATYEFSGRATARLITEWTAVVRRDSSHPCIVTWVPINESWGVQHVANDPAQQHLVKALTSLTRALDPTRPVISNDGWEHLDSDLWTIHDYAETGEELAQRYGTQTKLVELLHRVGAAGRVTALLPELDRGQPFLLTEFGGISLNVAPKEGAWGYSEAKDAEDFEQRLANLFAGLRDAPLAGFCYTQLTDTGLETNGLLHADRSTKIATDAVRAIVTKKQGG